MAYVPWDAKINLNVYPTCSCNFCGSYYGCCVTMYISISLFCASVNIEVSVYCNTEVLGLSSDQLSCYIKAQAFSILDLFFKWDSLVLDWNS